MFNVFSRITLILVAVAALSAVIAKSIVAGSLIGPYWILLLIGVSSASLLSLRLADDVRFVVALCLIITGGGLVGLDYYVSRNVPLSWRDQLINWWEAEGVDYDPRGKLQVIEDLSDDGVTAYPEVLIRLLLEDNAPLRIQNGLEGVPLGGMSNSTVVYCNESGTWVIDVSDKHGFNNPPGHWNETNVSSVALGDSFVVGACVEPDKTLIARIRAEVPGLLNLGRSGTAQLVQLAILREYVSALQPELVLWFYYEGNDLLELESERDHPVLMRYLNDRDFSQGLSRIQPLINQYLDSYVQTRYRDQQRADYSTGRDSRLIDLLQLRNLRAVISANNRPQPQRAAVAPPEFLAEALASAGETIRSWGGELVFVYLPGGDRYAKARELPPQYELRQEVLQVVKTLGIPIVDVNKVFDQTVDPLSFFAARSPLHYTVEGHALAAQAVVDYVKNSTRASVSAP